MFKLLKEIFKSLSKNKITVISLSILLFLTTGVFSLLFSVKESFRREVDRYSQVSKLHDSTVDLDINFANSNKNSIYYKSQENEYTIANNEVISNTNLRLPSNFIKLSELGIQGEEGNFYISANEFKVQYEINKNTYDLSKKEFSYDLANATFSVLKDKTKLFKKYKLNADGSYTEAKSVVTLKKDSTIVLDKQYTLNDVVTIVSRGEVGGLFNAGSDGQVSAINRLAINVETREATFDAAKINTWDNFGLLYLVSEEDTARILGFERNGSSWKIIRRRDYSSDLFNWDDIAQWAQPTIAWNYNTVYKPEGKMKVSNNTSPVIKNLSIANDYSVEFPQTFSFAKANTYKLNKAWIFTTSTEIKYKKVTYKLYDISDKHRFSNAFSIYLKRLKEEQPQEFAKIESLSFWQKEIVTTDAKNQSKTISQRLSKDDLVIELKDKKDPSKTVFIKDLENLGNELNIRELTNEQLYQLSNSDIVELSYLKLKNAVSQTVKEAIYKDINEDKRVLEIGERKFITVNSINDSTGENKIYQFIDSGISNDLYRENQAQNVGKLFNETLQKSNLFLPEDTSIQKNEINVDFSTQIIAAIFQGYVPNKNFIDPKIEFINIMYKDKDSIFQTEETNKKVVILKSKTNPSLEYALGENKGNYSIFVKNNENWEPFYYKTKSSLSIYELNEFIASNDLILDAKIGPNGWFKENDEFSNSYSVPFLYRTPSSELLKEIETNKTIKSLTDSIKKAIVNSDLISEHYIQLESIEKLLSAMEQAWAETGYYQIFINGKNDFALMQKMIFETLYIATNQNNDGFLNDIISDFISKIKEKISLKPTLQEQKDYFFEEFEKLGKMLDNFGLSFWKNLIEIAPLNYLKTTINSPIEFLEGIRIMVDSFDFKQFLSEVHNWYIQKWDTQENSELKAYYYFGQADLVVPLLKSINYDTFKQGAIKIVDQINFDSLFSTLYDNSENRYKGIIFNQLIKNYAQSKIKDQLTNTLKEIFNKINANKDLSKTELNFSNVKEGIKTLINNFDKKQLLSVVETSLNNTYFEGYKTVANSKNPQKVTFVTKTLKNTELAVSFIAALFKDSNTRVQVNNAIKSILNLSGKTKYEGAFTVYYSVPDKDDQKLDLFSLQNLEILSYANYEDLETKTDQLISKITQNSFVLDNSDIAFIKKNLFKNKEIYDNKTEILKRLNELKSIINFFKLNAYKKQGNYFIKQNDNLSIADNLYALFNESFQDAGGNTALIQAKDKAKAIVSDVVHTSEFSAAVNSLVFYNFWIKFITENPQLSQAELNEAFNLIFDTVNNKSSQLYQILNNTTLYDNKANFSQATLAFGQDIQPLGRGILQPFETSQEIFSNNPQNSALAQEVNKLFTSELFTKQTEQHKETLAIWISKNKAQFVSSIAQIAHFRKFHGASKYFDYLKKGFSNINKLLENDSKKEIIENVLKTFSQQSSIMQTLGLSDVVASTYQGVIFPTVAAWFTTNPSAQNGEENNANLTWVLDSRIVDFSKIITTNKDWRENIRDRFHVLLGDQIYYYKLENHSSSELSLDLAFVSHLDKKIFSTTENNQTKDLKIFDINLNNLFYKFIDAATVIREENKLIVFKDIRSLVAKVNQSFLNENGKKVYTEKLPTSYLELNKLIDSLDEKYVINVNGSKFLIVGTDTTIDYIFPVINEENLQVNSKTQGLVYVNKYGFDRVRESFRGNAIKNYYLVKLKDKTQAKEFNNDINLKISQNYAEASMKKAFTTDEFDVINPERTLRISTAFSMILAINSANFYIVLILVILVLISTVFITKRYIATRNKVIGILRAQGYSSLKIAFSFISFPFVTSILGGIAGYSLGLILQSPLKQSFSSYWTLPTENLSFEWIPFMFSTLVPFVILSFVVIVSALIILRKKPIELMSGIAEISVGKVSQTITSAFRKRNIKTKFGISLTINSFWKLMSLMISTVLTTFISLFSIASNGIFESTVNTTYKNRKYKYKLDLITPTKEGGAYSKFSKDELQNLLYVPLGEASESNLENNSYFRPGRSLVNGESDKNGNPEEFSPHILTRASLQLQVESSLSISPWDVVLNSMPDSQRIRTLKISEDTIKKIEKTQNIQTQKIKTENSEYEFEYVGTLENPQNYFKYINDSSVSTIGKFWYMSYNPETKEYQKEAITTKQYRDQYRKFLVDAYSKIDSDDFYIAFNGVQFDNKTNETYSYIETGFGSEQQLKIYGYETKSKYIQIQDKYQNNLLEVAEKTEIKDDVYPLLANYVFLQKHNLNLGDQIELEIRNSTQRYLNKISDQAAPRAKFRIIGLIDTYINSELATTKEVANKLIGLLDLKGPDAFNGILSNDELPKQTIASTGLYSVSGYWFGADTINPQTPEEYENYFAQLFATKGSQVGSLVLSGYSEQQVIDLINWEIKDNKADTSIDLSYENITKVSFKQEHSQLIKQAVNNFIKLYSKNVYQAISTQVDAKDIEIGFVQNISTTVSKLTLATVIILFIVSIVILIMISNMIITENEKNIAIFSILGYNNWEKIKLFFGVYLPLIIISTLIAIPFVIGAIALFNAFLISSSSIVLLMALKWWHVLISLAILIFVFVVTSVIAWFNLNKIKAIYLLKGK